MYVCNKCREAFPVPAVTTRYNDGIKVRKTVCPYCDSGDIYEYRSRRTDKQRMAEYVFDNLPDINKTNRAIKRISDGGTTKLDCVVNYCEELVADLLGENRYRLSTPLSEVETKLQADRLFNEFNSILKEEYPA